MGRAQLLSILIVIALLATVPPLPWPQGSERDSWLLEAASTTVEHTSPPPKKPATALPARFTLLNWNSYKQNEQHQWQQEYDHLLSQYQPQLITLQEAVTSPTPWPHQRPFAIFAPNLEQQPQFFGLMTLSTVAPTQHWLAHSPTKEPILNTPKIALYSQYPLAQHSLLLVNVHAINFATNNAYQQHLTQLTQTIQRHQQEHGAVIVSGDLNSWNANRMQRLHDSLAHLNLQPVRFDNEEIIRDFLGYPLDHIFISPNLKVLQAQALADYHSSDHQPLVATFEFHPHG
ncbi:MAG: endonuclease/exonuclease/phosphatase family protein [Ferrimonas sp.]